MERDLHQGVSWLHLRVKNFPGGCVEDELSRYNTGGKEINCCPGPVSGSGVRRPDDKGPDMKNIYGGKLAGLNGNRL